MYSCRMWRRKDKDYSFFSTNLSDFLCIITIFSPSLVRTLSLLDMYLRKSKKNHSAMQLQIRRALFNEETEQVKPTPATRATFQRGTPPPS